MALTGLETLYVLGQNPTGVPAATTQQTTTGAIAALAAVESTPITSTAITTVGNGVLTGAGLVGGQIVRTGPVAAYSDATDTAAAIIAALPAFVTGSTFIARIKNATAFTQTITAGTGVTLPLTVIIPAFSVGTYYGTVTSATAVTFTHLTTVPIATGSNLTALAVTSIATVGAGTITAAAINGGYVARGGSQSGTPFTDTTDTAAAIIAACANLVNKIGTSLVFVYGNTTNALATITGGTGVTVSGVTVIPAGMVAQYLVTYTAAGTLTMVGIGVTQITPGSFAMTGSTSGETIVQATAIASGTLTLPAVTDTLAVLGTAQNFTAAQTFNNSSIKLKGSSTGVNTFTALNAGASNFTNSLPAVTGVVAQTSGANLYISDITRCTSAQTANTNIVLANITGLVQTVVAGTYRFRCVLPSTVAAGAGGIKYAFNYTTAVVSSIEATGIGYTASAVAVQHTTTATAQATLFTQAAVVIMTIIEGTMVVGTGGTVNLQMCQSASDASNSVALVGSYMEFTQIA